MKDRLDDFGELASLFYYYYCHSLNLVISSAKAKGRNVVSRKQNGNSFFFVVLHELVPIAH